MYINCDLTIGDEGTLALCRGLETNSTLQVLSFICCGCGPKGAQGIADIIKYAKTAISTLSIRGNTIQGEGLTLIGNALENNKSLTYLNVANIGIGPLDTEAIKIFSKNMVKCETLNAVDFNYNSFGDAGARVLLKELNNEKKNGSSGHIKQLAITNQISSDLFDEIFRTNRGGKKGKKKKKKNKGKKGGGKEVEILPDIHYALEWMKKLQKLALAEESEEKKGDKKKKKKKKKG